MSSSAGTSAAIVPRNRRNFRLRCRRCHFTDAAAGRHVQRREQRRGPVPHVIMGLPLRLARPQRQNRRGAVERLNLALFIDRQEERAIGRHEIQPNDVAQFVDERRIF